MLKLTSLARCYCTGSVLAQGSVCVSECVKEFECESICGAAAVAPDYNGTQNKLQKNSRECICNIIPEDIKINR